MSIIIFLIILAVLVLVHEFGHFIVAKKSGIRVDEFGLGFPPKIFSKKWGSTLYTLNAIPFGGFVKIFGEDPHLEEIKPEERKTSFYYKPKWIQASVLVAGVTMNIIFAWFVLSLGFMIGLPAEAEYSGFGRVSDIQLTITSVLPDSPAGTAGLISGDTIIYMQEGSNFLQHSDLTGENVSELVEKSNSEILLTYQRGDHVPESIYLKPEINVEVGKKIIGISMEEIGTLRLPVHLALVEGARTTYLMVKETVRGIAQFLWQTVQFKFNLSQVSGPVGIANVVGEASSLGFTYLLSLIALISINLAVINLLPFPALDGGRLLFVVVEAITKREVPRGFVRMANFIGFFLLITLMLVVTTHDIFKLF